MADLLQRLKQRKLVQWALAYVAFAFALIQVLDVVAGSYGWPHAVMHIVFGLLVLGFVVTLVLAWYHGERGAQRVSGAELLLIALVLAVGGGLLWHFAQTPATNVAAKATASTRSAIAATSNPAATPVATTAAVNATSASALAAPTTTQPIPAKSVAVLPFENLSTDKGNAYFADGMQDLILTKLADIGDLKVISRTSTMKYASHPEDLKTVGQQLGVATILEGSVQKAGNQVLINVQLIDARTDNHLWAESYTRTLDNIFGVEGEVAQKVADELNAKLTQAENAKVASIPTQNPAAFDDYLRGEHHLSVAMAGNFKTLSDAVDAYRKATQADPEFALAFARLAFAQSMLNYTSIDISKTTGQRALADAQRALALAPNLPQAHLAMGYVYRFDLRDDDKALSEFRLAQLGLPNDAEVEAAIAYIDDDKGDAQSAATRLERAVTLDPRSPDLAVSLGDMYMQLREYDRARVAYKRVLALAPDDPEGYNALARLDVMQRGDVDAALAELAKAPAALQSSPEIVNRRVGLLLLKHDYTAAQKVVATLQPGGRFVTPARVALKRGTVNHFAGNATEARKDFEQTLVLARSAIRAGKTEGFFPLIYAELGLGDMQAAIRAAQQARASYTQSKTNAALYGVQYALAVVDATSGDATPAVAKLDALLAASSTGDEVSAPLLKLDPIWDPIRNDPAFQTLLKEYANAAPASASSP